MTRRAAGKLTGHRAVLVAGGPLSSGWSEVVKQNTLKCPDGRCTFHGAGRRSGLFFYFFEAITAAEQRALTLVEDTHYQLITTGISREREHIKEELDDQGRVVKKMRERTRETVIDPAGMRWFMERRDPERWPTVRMIEHSGAIEEFERNYGR